MLVAEDEGVCEGMAEVLPIEVPVEYTRKVNKDRKGVDHPIPDDRKFSYGTAGFRSHAQDLAFILYRVGYLAGLRARVLNKTVGVMITASHNQCVDNGVKVVDPMGEMMNSKWEDIATELINATDEQLPTNIRALEVQMAPAIASTSAKVILGMDTRDSGPHLLQACQQGLGLIPVPHESFGLLTTPQLHYITRCINDPSYGEPTETGYYERFSSAYNKLFKITPNSSMQTKIFLDCSNGIAAPQMRKLLEYIEDKTMEVVIMNDHGFLNNLCGADYVKSYNMLPINYMPMTVDDKCASFDGDVDRLVYFRRRENNAQIVLVTDGDKIAVLFAKYIRELLENAGLTSKLTLGIVQTAYANGASTIYIRDTLGIEPVFSPTGVKNLHQEAQKFDIGIYFEANGHGTVHFSPKFDDVVRNSGSQCIDTQRLRLFSLLLNETVGDAIADFLAVELVLRHYQWSLDMWMTMLYEELPCVMDKIKVDNRNMFRTTWSETELIEPADLQKKINQLVAQYPKARCFVRPSGTEAVVRVYAEAADRDHANLILKEVGDLVKLACTAF